MTKNLRSKIILNIFIAILLLPALDRKLHFFPTRIPTEKRDLASRPNYHQAKSIVQLTKDFEAYWNDNFGGRTWFINLHSQLFTKYLGESPVPYVLIGNKGWLFYRSELKNDGPGLNDFQGSVPFGEAELTQIINNVVDIKQRLSDVGIDLVIVVAPNKHTIYPEMLPSSIISSKAVTRLDQLVKASSGKFVLIDPRSDLTLAKSTYPTYYTTDSHWNDYGAFITANRITPIDITQFEIKSEPILGEGDLASMMSSRGIFPDTFISLTPKNGSYPKTYDFTEFQNPYLGQVHRQTGTKLPIALLYGDSFRMSLAPYIALNFSTTYVVQYTPKYNSEDKLIDFIEPNIIVWQVAERYLDRLGQKIY